MELEQRMNEVEEMIGTKDDETEDEQSIVHNENGFMN